MHALFSYNKLRERNSFIHTYLGAVRVELNEQETGCRLAPEHLHIYDMIQCDLMDKVNDCVCICMGHKYMCACE